MNVSHEAPHETRTRLQRVLATSELTVFEGLYAFEDAPAGVLREDALAYVRDGASWSRLVPSSGSGDGERFTVFSFHFRDDLDNSGFIGWLASELKAATGSGVFVICGYNRERGGVFDYWGCPAEVGQSVLATVRALAGG